MSHGLVIATAFATAYLVVGAVADVRRARATRIDRREARGGPRRAVPRRVAHRGAADPRARTWTSSASPACAAATARSAKPASPRSAIRSAPTASGRRGRSGFASAPGAYAGAVALACALLAARARRLRPLVVAVGGLALAAYVLTSSFLVEAGWFRSLMLEIPFGDVYLHNPGRLRYVVVLALPILAAAGHPGARRAAAGAAGGDRMARRRRGRVLPLASRRGRQRRPVRDVRGRPAGRCAAALRVRDAHAGGGHRRPRSWACSPWSSWRAPSTPRRTRAAPSSRDWRPASIPSLVPQVLRYPDLSERDYLGVTPIVEHLRAHPGRYATWAPPAAFYEKGYLWMKSPLDWPALAPSRGSLFGVPDALGYNPVQLPRYWRYIRTHERAVGLLQRIGPQRALVRGRPAARAPLPRRPDRHRAARGRSPGRGGRRLLAVGARTIAQPLATVVAIGRVRRRRSRRRWMRSRRAGFDPSEQAVIEPCRRTSSPASATAPRPAAADHHGDLRVRAGDPAPGVERRHPHRPQRLRRRAGARPRTVDPRRRCPWTGSSRESSSPRETREVVLTYHDDAVMLGLALGAGIWLVLLGGAAPRARLRTAAARPDAARAGAAEPRPTRPPTPGAGARPR